MDDFKALAQESLAVVKKLLDNAKHPVLLGDAPVRLDLILSEDMESHIMIYRISHKNGQI